MKPTSAKLRPSRRTVVYGGALVVTFAFLLIMLPGAEAGGTGQQILVDSAVDGSGGADFELLRLGASSDAANIYFWVKVGIDDPTFDPTLAANHPQQLRLPVDLQNGQGVEHYANNYYQTGGAWTNNLLWHGNSFTGGFAGFNIPAATWICNEAKVTVPRSTFDVTVANGDVFTALMVTAWTNGAIHDVMGGGPPLEQPPGTGTWVVGQNGETWQKAPSLTTLALTGDNDITVTWSAPSDNGAQPISQYRIYRSTDGGTTYALAGTTDDTTTTFVDTGRETGKTHHYKVSGVNCGQLPAQSLSDSPAAVGGETGRSNVLSIDTEFRPGEPVLATDPNPNAFDATVTWSIPADCPGIAGTCDGSGATGIGGYELYRSLDATVDETDTLVCDCAETDTSKKDTGLDDYTRYYYAIRAKDKYSSGPNIGAFSNTITLFTPDGTPPTKITTLMLQDATTSGFTASWVNPSDNVGVVGVDLHCDTTSGFLPNLGNRIATGASTPHAVTGRDDATTYYCVARAYDEANNYAEYSDQVSITTLDGTDPSAATLSATDATETTLTWTWTAATDNVAVAGYELYCGATGFTPDTSGYSNRVAATADLTTTVSGLDSGTNYNCIVRALDAAGNDSFSAEATGATVQEVDVTPPTTVTDLVLGGASLSTLQASWSPATDSNGVSGYELYCSQISGFTPGAGNLIDAAAMSPVELTGLNQDTTYYCLVRGYDSSGNMASFSNQASGTTLEFVDTEAPSQVMNLMASNPTANGFDLTWDAATDNVEVANYKVHCMEGLGITATPENLIWAVTTTSTTLVGLLEGTEYSCVVAAVDGSGNTGTQSLGVAETTLDVTPPSEVMNLVASAEEFNGFQLDWDGATDNIAVAGYEIYCDLGSLTPDTVGKSNMVATSATTTSVLTTLLPAEVYTCAVRAYDAAGNFGDWSNEVEATTLNDGSAIEAHIQDPGLAIEGQALVVTSSVFGGAPPRTCDWSGEGGVQVASATCAGAALTWAQDGTYLLTLEATDGEGNVATDSRLVTVEDPPLSLTIQAPAVNTVDNVFAATVAITGGEAPYSCAWSGTVDVIGDCNGATVTATSKGAKTLGVVVTDAKNRILGANHQLAVTGPVQVSIVSVEGIGDYMVAATIEVTEGLAPYSCSWSSTPVGTIWNDDCSSGQIQFTTREWISMMVDVTDAAGNVASDSADYEVLHPEILADIQGAFDQGEGQVGEFLLAFSGGDGTFVCEWAFELAADVVGDCAGASVTFTQPGAGDLTVTITDGEGNIGIGLLAIDVAPVPDVDAPVISTLTPGHQAVVGQEVPRVGALAFDAYMGLDFTKSVIRIDGVYYPVLHDENGPYTVPLNLYLGEHVVFLYVEDVAGNSNEITWTFANTKDEPIGKLQRAGGGGGFRFYEVNDVDPVTDDENQPVNQGPIGTDATASIGNVPWLKSALGKFVMFFLLPIFVGAGLIGGIVYYLRNRTPTVVDPEYDTMRLVVETPTIEMAPGDEAS